MRIRTLALAGAATVALSAPALADHVGWYLGLGAGYEQTQSTHLIFPPDPIFPVPSAKVKEKFGGSGIYLADAGYKFLNGFRAEGEIAYKNPNAKIAGFCEGAACKGGLEVGSVMVNLVYDWNVGDDWGISLGGGFGAADVNDHVKAFGACVVCGGQWGAALQGIAGVYFELGDDWDLSAEYRYRTEWVDHDYRTEFEVGPTENDAVHVNRLYENAGIRALGYYLGHKPPPPPSKI